MTGREPGFVPAREPGFRAGRKTYRLVFEDGHDLAGLVVKARSVGTGEFFELSKLADGRFGLEEGAELIARFAQHLISWNLEEEDGRPVPATHEGLLSQDFDTVIAVIMQWMDAVAGVSGPLAQPSPGGDQSLVASIPMETLSPNPVSSGMPA